MTVYKHRWAGTVEHTLRRLAARALPSVELPDLVRYDLYSEPVSEAELYYVHADIDTPKGQLDIEFTMTVHERAATFEDTPLHGIAGVRIIGTQPPEPTVGDVTVTLAGKEVYASWDPDTGNWHATGPVPVRQAMPAAYAVGEAWACRGLVPRDYADAVGRPVADVAADLKSDLPATELAAMLAFADFALAAVPVTYPLPDAAIPLNALEP